MHLVETTGAKARAAGSFDDAMAAVISDVADATGWLAGHAWVPAAVEGAWVSSGVWHPVDGMRLGGLRRACMETLPIPARGHVAMALLLQGTRWVGDLSGLIGTPLHDAATAAGVKAAVACPVYVGGHAVAVLEWYLDDTEPVHADVPNVLGHLSAVLSEVAERPVRDVVEQGTYRTSGAIRLVTL